MDATIRALAEPNRREILELVRAGELAASEIAARFDVTRAAISQHMQVLGEAGLVSERRDGTRRLYRARAARLDELKRYLDELAPAGASTVEVTPVEAGEDTLVLLASLGERDT